MTYISFWSCVCPLQCSRCMTRHFFLSRWRDKHTRAWRGSGRSSSPAFLPLSAAPPFLPDLGGIFMSRWRGCCCGCESHCRFRGSNRKSPESSHLWRLELLKANSGSLRSTLLYFTSLRIQNHQGLLLSILYAAEDSSKCFENRVVDGCAHCHP